MTQKNKKLEIASGIVGGVYALVHMILAAGLFGEAAILGGTSTEGMGIIVLFFYSIQFVAVLFAIAAAAAAVWCVAAVIIPLRTQNVKTVRRVAISVIVLLVLRMIIDVNFIFGFVVNGFRDGDYLLAILSILYIVLTLGWFVLNIIRTKIYKVKKDSNQ